MCNVHGMKGIWVKCAKWIGVFYAQKINNNKKRAHDDGYQYVFFETAEVGIIAIFM